jgi:hypothetical protein
MMAMQCRVEEMTDEELLAELARLNRIIGAPTPAVLDELEAEPETITKSPIDWSGGFGRP